MGKSTMNEDVNEFPIEIGDFPASYVSFQRCICHLAASPVVFGDFFLPGKEMDPTDLTKQLVLDGTSIRTMAGGEKHG